MTTWLASTANADFTFSEADLLATWTGASAFGAAHANLARPASGSWYFEIEVETAAAAHDIMIGVCRPNTDLNDPGSGANGYYYYTSVVSGANAYRYNNGAAVSDAGYAVFAAPDVIGVLLKNGKVYFSLNDVWQDGSDPDAETGEAFSGLTGDMYPSIVCYNNGDQLRAKFAPASLVGTLPTGAVAWDAAPNGLLVGDLPLITGALIGDSGVDGDLAGDLPLITGDFPGGQGFFAAIAGDVPLLVGEFAAIVSYAGAMAGEFPLISGEFIGGYSVAGTMGGDLPLVSGEFAGTTTPGGILAGDLPLITGAFVATHPVPGVLVGDVPLITGAFVGGMATVAALAGDVPLITGAFNDGPIGVIAGEFPLITGAAVGWVGSAAAGIWLHLHTSPSAQIFSLDTLRGRLNPYLPTHRIDDLSASPLQAQTGRQNESWSVALTGASAELRARCAKQLPFGVRARLFDGGELLREGITDGIDYKGRTLSITLQSAGWSTDLPIRTTADLGTFRDVEPVAWRYGRNVSGALISIDNTRKRFVWADHPCKAVRSLTTSDGEAGPAFEMRNMPDSTGRPICVVLTAEQVEDGVELIAVGDGAMDAVSGDLLTNPADIVRDICNKAGRAISKGTLARFRRDCLARNLEIVNSITGGTLQAAMESIAASVHAVFARSHRELLRLLPITAPVAGTLDARYLEGRTSDSDDIATRLLVRYALENGKPRASLEVRATAVELAHGIRPKEVTLEWIADDRSAADVGERKLQDDSRPSYKLTYSAVQRQWVPGETATVSDPGLGLSGTALVESVTGFAPMARLRIGTVPTVALAALSAAYVPEPISLGSVGLVGGNREFTINDADGRPAVGARCTLDGGVTRVTDGRGVVSFPASLLQPGPHTILVVYQGEAPYPLSFSI